MTPQSTRALLLLSGVLFALFPIASAGDDLAEQLKSDYAGKVLTLRHFYKGNHLSFESDGSLINRAEEGPWTVDGQVSVNTIRVNQRTVHVNGRRVGLIFDSKSKVLRDELALLAELKAKTEEQRAREKALRENLVDIDIILTSPNPTEHDVSTAMDAVFLSPEQSPREVVPDFWRGYFDRVEGQTSGQDFPEQVYKVKPGEVSAPRVLYRINPEFSEEARNAIFHGTMTLALVVDHTGSTKNVEIASPLGMGLDEKSVEAVRQWRLRACHEGRRTSSRPDRG